MRSDWIAADGRETLPKMEESRSMISAEEKTMVRRRCLRRRGRMLDRITEHTRCRDTIAASLVGRQVWSFWLFVACRAAYLCLVLRYLWLAGVGSAAKSIATKRVEK